MKLYSFSKGIKKARKKAGIRTQQELADLLGVTLKTVQNWEQGLAAPSFEMLETISEKLNCDYDYLFDRLEVPTHEKQFVCNYTGLSEKALDNLCKYDKGEISVLNTLLSCGLFSQVLQHYGKYLTSEYCIPVHPIGDQWKVSDFDGFDGYGGFLYLASSINNPSDNIPMPFDSSFVEDHEMNQIRDYLKDIKKIATEQIKPLNSKL